MDIKYPIYIPWNTIPKIEVLLANVEKQWAALQQAVETIRSVEVDLLVFHQQLDLIRSLNLSILDETNDAVDQLAEASERQVSAMMTVEL